jgi:hypothetical protein
LSSAYKNKYREQSLGIGKKSVYKILKDAAPDFHDLDNLGDPDKDVAISCSSRFVARLYDQKKSFVSPHHNINKLATSQDASLSFGLE